MISTYTKFEVSSFSVKNLGMVLILKIALNPNHASFLGYFVISKMVLAMIYMYTKYEVPIASPVKN